MSHPTRISRVLVIDDSTVVRQLAVALLQRAGYQVLQSVNGEEGLALARRELPDLIVCDINMPVLDGWGFVAQARQCAELQTLPILMLTANQDRESARRAMSTGADDYLTKPWKPDELLQAVKALEHKRARHKADTERSLNQLRGAILATVPHELRTPLTSILGLTRLMIDRHDRYPPERMVQMLHGVHEAAAKLGRTIARMMEWAELTSAGPQALVPRSLHDGAVLVQQLMADPAVWRDIAAAVPGEPRIDQPLAIDGHTLQVKLEPGALLCDAHDLRRMLVELVGNAVRFSQPGMPVGITGRLLPGEGYALDVANVGLAMPAQFIQQIGALSQANRDKMEQQGMGLGLALTRLWAQRNQASLGWPRHDGHPTIARLLFQASSAE